MSKSPQLTLPHLGERPEVVLNNDGIPVIHSGARIVEITGLELEDVQAFVTAIDRDGDWDAAVSELANTYEHNDILSVMRLLRGIFGEAPEEVSGKTSETVPPKVSCVSTGNLGVRLARHLPPDYSYSRCEEEKQPELLELVIAATESNPNALILCLDGSPMEEALKATQYVIRQGVCTLFVTYVGSRLVVGPYLRPGVSPCLFCALATLYSEANPHKVTRLLPSLTLPKWEQQHSSEASLLMAAGIVSAELGKALRGVSPEGGNTLSMVDDAGSISSQPVVPVVDCPACFGLGAKRLNVEAMPETVEPVGPTAPPIDVHTGLRSTDTATAIDIARKAFTELGITPTFTHTGPPQALVSAHPALQSLQFVHLDASAPFPTKAPRRRLREQRRALGKGMTYEQAWCSCVFEWFEESFSEFGSSVALVRAPYSEIETQALDIELFCRGKIPGLNVLRAEELSRDVSIDWVWGTDIVSRKPCLLPAATAHTLSNVFFEGSQYSVPERGSSGLAAGTAQEDAVLEGLLEVIEHDASFAAAATMLPFPAISLASIKDDLALEALDALTRAGYDVQIRDLTNDIGVPVLETALLSRDDHTNYWGTGLGCNLDPLVALRRSITEAFQMLCFNAMPPVTSSTKSSSGLLASYGRRKQVWGNVLEADSLRGHDPKSCATVAGSIASCTSKIVDAIPGSQIVAYPFPGTEGLGVHVVNVVVSGVFDSVPHPIHVPSRIRNYRETLGRKGAIYDFSDLRLERMPP